MSDSGRENPATIMPFHLNPSHYSELLDHAKRKVWMTFSFGSGNVADRHIRSRLEIHFDIAHATHAQSVHATYREKGRWSIRGRFRW